MNQQQENDVSLFNEGQHQVFKDIQSGIPLSLDEGMKQLSGMTFWIVL